MTIATTDPLVSTAQPLATERLTAESATVTNDPEKQLAALLSAITQWRKNKKHTGEMIPDQLLLGIFALENTYPPAELRRIFNLSNQQYERKHSKLRLTPDDQSSQSTNTPSHDAAIAGSTAHSATTASTPTLCEVKIKPQNPYAPEPLPSARTLVVEFCRADGRVMKIHTTQDSIPTLIQNFYRGDAAC